MSRVQLVFLINDHEAESVCSSTSSVTSPGESSSTARFSTSSATFTRRVKFNGSLFYFVRHVEPVFIRRSTTSFVPDSSAGTLNSIRPKSTLHEVAPSPTDLRSSTCHASMQTFGTLLELRDHLSFTISKGNF